MERPECDFGQLPLFREAIPCQYCKQETLTPFWVEKQTDKGPVKLPFCNERHANEYYLAKLRESGL